MLRRSSVLSVLYHWAEGSLDETGKWNGTGNSPVVVLLEKIGRTGYITVSAAPHERFPMGFKDHVRQVVQNLVLKFVSDFYEARGEVCSEFLRSRKEGNPPWPKPHCLLMNGSGKATSSPDLDRYRTLIEESGWALRRLEISVYLVGEDGVVEKHGLG